MIVHLKDASLDDIVPLEDQLEPAIAGAGVGEYDGNEVALDGSEAVLYAYGPDADALWDVMKPLLGEFEASQGSFVLKRYGEATDATAREVRLDIG